MVEAGGRLSLCGVFTNEKSSTIEDCTNKKWNLNQEQSKESKKQLFMM